LFEEEITRVLMVGVGVGVGVATIAPFQICEVDEQTTILLHKSGVPLKMPKLSALTYLAVAKPITLPLLSNTGPPELPGLIAAVVVPKYVELFTLETIPVVRIPGKPSGLPMMPAHQPCCGLAPR
jgi:hypothetical protein